MTYRDIFNKIEQLRFDKGLIVHEMALQIGVTWRTYTNIKAGKKISHKTASKMVKYLRAYCIQIDTSSIEELKNDSR